MFPPGFLDKSVPAIPLTLLRQGARAVVVRVEGGFGLTRKLAHLGIRPGKVVEKVSSMVLSGPIVVRVEGREVALGRGMAARVLVRREDPV